MAITLTSAFLAQLSNPQRVPSHVFEVALDGGTVYWGTHANITADVQPIVKSVSSLQNRLEKSGWASRGQITFTVTGRDNFKTLIKNNYLKNRRVVQKNGFIASGFAYSDYAATYTGKITDWSRKGDDLTVTVQDDSVDMTKKLPVENAAKTQYLDYRNTNAVNAMTDMIQTRLGISTTYFNLAKFQSERDTWLPNWLVSRVITEPKEAKEYLNELQIETNSFIIHDGEKISYKVWAPPLPGQTVDELTDQYDNLHGSLSVKSGYREDFFNRVVVNYDYDESGSDGDANYETAVIAVDDASQGSGQWNEVATKTINSKWIRSFTFSNTTNITGLVIYHVSKANGAGAGTLSYTASTKALTYTAPGGSAGEAVTLSSDGKTDVYSSDKRKYVRVLVTTASLPGGNQTDTVTMTALSGEQIATALAMKLLSRYRDPVSNISMEIDLKNAARGSEFIKPTDIVDITTDEAFEYGVDSWSKERMIITSVQPDFAKGKVALQAMETKQYRRYGFIAPAGYPDYGSASDAQKEYGYVGDVNNKVGGGTIDGYYIW